MAVRNDAIPPVDPKEALTRRVRSSLFKIDAVDNPRPRSPFVILPIGFDGERLGASRHVSGELRKQGQGQRHEDGVTSRLLERQDRKPISIVVEDRADLDRVFSVRCDDDVGHDESFSGADRAPDLSPPDKPSNHIDRVTAALLLVFSLYMVGHFAVAWSAGWL